MTLTRTASRLARSLTDGDAVVALGASSAPLAARTVGTADAMRRAAPKAVHCPGQRKGDGTLGKVSEFVVDGERRRMPVGASRELSRSCGLDSPACRPQPVERCLAALNGCESGQ